MFVLLKMLEYHDAILYLQYLNLFIYGYTLLVHISIYMHTLVMKRGKKF